MKQHNITQISMEGKNMLRKAFNIFLDDLILDNASRHSDYFSLFACDLPYADKKSFLSHLVTIDDYEYYTKDFHIEREALKEYESEMQYLINQRIDDLYFEYQEERRQ